MNDSVFIHDQLNNITFYGTILNERKILRYSYEEKHPYNFAIYVFPFPITKLFEFSQPVTIKLTKNKNSMEIGIRKSFVKLQKMLIFYGFKKKEIIPEKNNNETIVYYKTVDSHRALISLIMKIKNSLKELEKIIPINEKFSFIRYEIDFSKFIDISKKETFTYVVKNAMKR